MDSGKITLADLGVNRYSNIIVDVITAKYNMAAAIEDIEINRKNYIKAKDTEAESGKLMLLAFETDKKISELKENLAKLIDFTDRPG